MLQVRCPGPLGSCSLVNTLGALCCCAVSWATRLLLTAVPARYVVLHVPCPGPLRSCSPVCPLGALSRVCGVLRYLVPVHRCAPSVPCDVCAVYWATWLLISGVPALCSVLRVRCPGPLGSCSEVCSLDGLCRVCGVLGHLAPFQGCARSVRCVACAVSWATWLLFTAVLSQRVVLRVRCPGTVDSCSGLCSLGVLCCCAVSWATWLLFTSVLTRCAVLQVPCPGLLDSCSAVCSLGVLWCVCSVLDLLAPVHRCARSVRCVACAVSWATSLLFTGVLARWVVSRVRCPGPRGSCSLMCPLGALCGVCGDLGHLTPVHRCGRLALCVAGAVSWATWLLFTGGHAWCVVLLCGVQGHSAPAHRCARSVRCVACAVSWATSLLFTGVLAQCFVLRVRCPGPLGSRSPVCSLSALCGVCGVPGHLTPVHWCARLACCGACAVFWAS